MAIISDFDSFKHCISDEDQIRRLKLFFTELNLNDNQWRAVNSFLFTEGYYHFEHSRLYDMIKQNPNSAAIRKEFERYTKYAGVTLPGLAERRKKEADLYFTTP